MPIATETLFDVLSFLNRRKLDALAAVNSYLNAFICKNFPSSPFNCINKLYINTESKSFRVEITATFAYSSLQKVQQLANSCKWMVKCTQLNVQLPWFVPADWKSKLESISSLWQGSTLVLTVIPNPYLLAVSNSRAVLREMFTWSGVFTFSHFELIVCSNEEIKFPFHTFPLLYTFSKMKFNSYINRNLRTADLLTYLENIPKERQHSLIVSWGTCDRIAVNKLLDLAQQSFDVAESQCSFYLQIQTKDKSFAGRHFQLTNPVTRERLQFYLERPDEYTPVFALKRSSL